jgi:hypothetical protein
MEFQRPSEDGGRDSVQTERSEKEPQRHRDDGGRDGLTDDGRSSPPSRLRSVNLPEPLGPMMSRYSPRSTANDTPLRAATSWSPRRYRTKCPASWTISSCDAICWSRSARAERRERIRAG